MSHLKVSVMFSSHFLNSPLVPCWVSNKINYMENGIWGAVCWSSACNIKLWLVYCLAWQTKGCRLSLSRVFHQTHIFPNTSFFTPWNVPDHNTYTVFRCSFLHTEASASGSICSIRHTFGGGSESYGSYGMKNMIKQTGKHWLTHFPNYHLKKLLFKITFNCFYTSF